MYRNLQHVSLSLFERKSPSPRHLLLNKLHPVEDPRLEGAHHEDFDREEIARLLKDSGLFITEQVGAKNDRDLVEFVLPDSEEPFPHLMLDTQRKAFEEAGFEIIRAAESFRPIKFHDTGAFVWFARIIEWEFPDFSVDNCLDRLYKMQEIIDRDGAFAGTIHRYPIVAKKR